MAAVQISPDVQHLRDEIASLLERIQARDSDSEDRAALLDRLAETAHHLHRVLAASGHEPKHHAYMIRNRGMLPDDPNFYRHVHPAEDLLKYLDDPHANDDPSDQTIGESFEFRVFSRRWNHEDMYRLTRTQTGWDLAGTPGGIRGRCDMDGYPYLFENLRHDAIEYPAGLGGWLNWVWQQARDKGLSRDEVQSAISDLANWVTKVERSSPQDDVWRGYKG